MSVLNKYFKLSQKVSVIVPSTVNVDEVNFEKQEKYVAVFMEELSKMFGGVSVETILGGWVSDNKGLVKEENKRVYAFASEITEENLEKIITLVEVMKEDMTQEAIALEVNNELYFI